jgi:CheY-like chemotaxis protein
LSGATAQAICAAIRKAGMPSMRDRALELVARSVMSIEEVNRVLAPEENGTRKVSVRTRVLITDDEPMTRMVLKLSLEKDGYEVLQATNGREAVELAARERPELLIMDLNMPEVDGYAAIARIRRELPLATVPILVLTGDDQPGTEQRVLELGADDYLIKPFDAAVRSRVMGVFQRVLRPAA